MAWIESHQELGRHPKLLRLAKHLGISCPAAVGHLHYLWWWAVDYAPDGNLNNLGPEEIADAAAWDGDPAIFVDALYTTKFLDESNALHDWMDYAGRLIEMRQRTRLANAKRQKDYRQRHYNVSENVSNAVSNALYNGPVTDSNGLTVPNPTQQNPTRPNRETGDKSPPPQKEKPVKIKKETEQTVVTADFRQKMVERWGPILGAETIEETIKLALSHTNAKKYGDQQGYVNNWLRNDANKRGNTNGHKPNVQGYSPGRPPVDDALGKY